jgi:hypothetical protein
MAATVMSATRNNSVAQGCRPVGNASLIFNAIAAPCTKPQAANFQPLARLCLDMLQSETEAANHGTKKLEAEG